MNCSPEWFQTIFTCERTSAECPFCHRINNSDDPEEPLKVGILEGRQVVFGCPCGRLELFESWIWRNRDVILSYLSLRAENRFKESQEMMGRAANIAGKLRRIKG